MILDEADAMTQDAQNALRRGEPSVLLGVALCELARLTEHIIWPLVNKCICLLVLFKTAMFGRFKALICTEGEGFIWNF